MELAIAKGNLLTESEIYFQHEASGELEFNQMTNGEIFSDAAEAENYIKMRKEVE